MTTPLRWVYDNAGSTATWTRSKLAGCEVRAIALACALPHATVYAELYRRRKAWIKGNWAPKAGSKRVYARAKRVGDEEIPREVYHDYLIEQGFSWHPGSAATIDHLDTSLPSGRLVVVLRKGLTAVVDHVVLDVYDPMRSGKTRHYGYYQAPTED